MFTAEQIADHPFPEILISNNEAEAKVAAQDAARQRAEYAVVQLARHRIDGWTAERQRTFLAALADTGCVSVAAEAADITPRSCYRLRRHPQATAFAKAWDEALLIATGRLSAIAFERAIVGTPREIWRGGKLIAEMSVPSDKMMMFLLQHLLPRTYGQRGPGNGSVEERIANARVTMSATLGTLTDIDDESPEALIRDDYLPQPPREEGACCAGRAVTARARVGATFATLAPAPPPCGPSRVHADGATFVTLARAVVRPIRPGRVVVRR